MQKPDVKNIAEHLRVLVRERNPWTAPEQLADAGKYIRDQFLSFNLRVREEAVPFNGISSLNVLGLKEGLEPGSSTFVVAAHYDTVEATPGADDNASAVSALLETARCLSPLPLKHSLLFAAFTLEEYGWVGSRFFVEQAMKRKEPFLGMISLEMVGFYNDQPGSQRYPPYVDPARYPDAGNFIAVVGNEPSAKLTLAIADGMDSAIAGLAVEKLIVPGRGDRFREVTLSDHFPFWERDIPAVMVTDTAFLRNPHYHLPSDSLETLDLEFIRKVTAGVCAFLQGHLQ